MGRYEEYVHERYVWEQQEIGKLFDEADEAWAQHQLELRQMQEECYQTLHNEDMK